ncbi:MAG: response regulator [Pseudomonadota bacterium]
MTSKISKELEDLRSFRLRDAPEGRFQRYGKARLRQFLMRQTLTLFGIAVIAGFIDLTLALLVGALAVLGEVFDLTILVFMLRRGISGFTQRWSDLFAAFGAMVQSFTFSICISSAWITGGAEFHFYCLMFFAAAALNGGIVANFHLLSAYVRLAIYSIAVIALIMLELSIAQLLTREFAMTLLSIVMLAITIFTFLTYFLQLQQKFLSQNGDLLTEKLRVEQALEAKTMFLSSASHQLRTPLNAILGASDMLAHSNPREDQKALLRPLRNSATDLYGLINDILDFTQIEKGQLMIQKQVIDLHVVINDVIEKFRQRAQDKSLSYSVTLTNALPRSVIGDADRISQIISKLLSNSIQFTKQGGIEIILAAQSKARSGLIFVKVIDTGDGIAPSKLKQILSSDSDQNTTRDASLGLGLRIARQLARQMGGSLSIETTDGIGTICRFVFEVFPSNTKANQHSEWNLANAAVLIAEDNKTNQLIVKKMLGPTGASLFFAKDGVEAVESAQKFRPDLILMDLAMPNKTGIEATCDIRAWEAENDLKPVPIIALTANAFESDKDSCTRAGMNGFLAKPVKKKTLIAELERAGNAYLS